MGRDRKPGPGRAGRGVILIAARVVRCGLAALAVVAVLASPAAAEGITRDELARRAEIAAFDDDALEELKEVDFVDGHRVDMERILEGAEGKEVVDRLNVLASQEYRRGTSVPASTVRTEAGRILEGERFQPPNVPRPFKGVLEFLADLFDPVIRFVDRVFSAIADFFSDVAGEVPGGPLVLWVLLAVIVLGLSLWMSQRMVGRHAREGLTSLKAARAGRQNDPRKLEAEANDAERRGDHELAIRLRFRAGLLRLGMAKVIPFRPSLTTGELRRLLTSPEFDRLGADFDEIVYGGRPAGQQDAAAARAGWERVLKKVAS
ncbi:MAG: DUF4129 domain-containing protein [Actinomycetota bacterium]